MFPQPLTRAIIDGESEAKGKELVVGISTKYMIRSMDIAFLPRLL